jgi:hypothetical protein
MIIIMIIRTKCITTCCIWLSSSWFLHRRHWIITAVTCVKLWLVYFEYAYSDSWKNLDSYHTFVIHNYNFQLIRHDRNLRISRRNFWSKCTLSQECIVVEKGRQHRIWILIFWIQKIVKYFSYSVLLQRIQAS